MVTMRNITRVPMLGGYTAAAAGGGSPVVVTTTQTKLAGVADNFIMTFPAAIASGDFLMAILSSDENYGVNVFAAPTGWTLEYHGGSILSDSTISIYTKIADGTETGTIVFGTDTTLSQAGVLFHVTNIDAVVGIEVISTAKIGEGVSIVIPSITTLSDNSLVVAACAFDGGDSGGFTVASPYTLLHSLTVGTAIGISQGTATYTLPTAGATGTIEFTQIGGAFEGIIGIQVALKPTV